MSSRSTFKAICLLVALAPAWAARGQPDAALPEAVSRAWMTLSRGGEARVVDRLPRAADARAGDWAAVVSVSSEKPFGARAETIELVDGSRTPGELVGLEEGRVRWRSARLGEFAFDLGEVAAIGARAPAEVGVVFANGDAASGAAEIDGDGVVVSSAIGRVRAGWDRVAGVRLREGRAAPEGLAVWLDSGGVLSAESVRENAGGRGVLVELRGGRLGQYRREEIVAVTRGGAIVRAAGRPETAEEMEPIGHGGWLARAPARAVWAMEAGTIGVFGAAAAPEGSREWSDALVSAWSGSEGLFSVRTNAERRTAALAAGVRRVGEGEELTVSVQPGAAGPAGGVTELWLGVVVAP